MRVERLLANLGYGKRRECQQMVKKGHVMRKDGGKLKVGWGGVRGFGDRACFEGQPCARPSGLGERMRGDE